jgi:hypothetical protein
MNPNHNAHLKVGERVVCTKDISFCNGSKHETGQILTVEPETQAYFSLFTHAPRYPLKNPSYILLADEFKI